MKKLLTICMVLSVMLSLTGISSAAMVMSPPSAPSWWNSEDATYYAYGWWSSDIIGGTAYISPTGDPLHWASNFLPNTDFRAVVGLQDETVTLDLNNIFDRNLYKKIYISITGTTISTIDNVDTVLNTDGGVFTGDQNWSITPNGEWTFVLSGEIRPQPDYVFLTFQVPGMQSVTNIWAGEVCVPEPATISMLGLGVLSLIRRKKLA